MASNIKYIQNEKIINHHMNLLILEINMMNNIIEMLVIKKKLYSNNKEMIEWLEKKIINETDCMNNTKLLFGMYLDQRQKLINDRIVKNIF